MTAALTLPGGRDLAAWWRDLVAHQPVRLWFADLLLHQIDAPVIVARPSRLDPLARVVLRGLAPDGRRAGFDAGLDPQVRAGVLRELRDAGLARADGPRWEPTAAGRDGLERG